MRRIGWHFFMIIALWLATQMMFGCAGVVNQHDVTAGKYLEQMYYLEWYTPLTWPYEEWFFERSLIKV